MKKTTHALPMKTEGPSIQTLLDTIALCCILLFFYAGGIKLLEYQKFTVQLGQSPMLKGLTGFIAWFIPLIELVVSIALGIGMLFAPRLLRWGMLAFFSLMALFTWYILAILFVSPTVPCSCGGVISEIGGWWGHLAFNLVFVGGSFYTLWVRELHPGARAPRKRTVLVAAAIPLLAVAYLAAKVDPKPGHRFAGFHRKHLIRTLHPAGAMDVKNDGYYIAGTDDAHIYLAHPRAIDQLLSIRRDLMDSAYIRLSLPPLRYIAATAKIQPPYFYLYDGNSGWMYRGKLDGWIARPYLEHARFVHAVPTNVGTVGFYGMPGRRNALGLRTPADTSILYRSGQLVEQGGEGMFSTDGKLVYQGEGNRFVFVYHYRNAYLVLDSGMNLLHTGHTIDTISQAKLKVAHNRADGQYVLQESVMVNQLAAVGGNRLYVKSMLLAGNEDKDTFDRNTVLDVYDLAQRAYLHSIYVPDSDGHKVRDFTVTEQGYIAALQGRELVLYPLFEQNFIAR